MKDKFEQPNLVPTRKRTRTFQLLQRRKMLSGMVQPSFGVLQTVIQKTFLPRVAAVFKKDRSPFALLTLAGRNSSQFYINISNSLRANYARFFSADVTIATHEPAKRFTSHLTLVSSSLVHSPTVSERPFIYHTTAHSSAERLRQLRPSVFQTAVTDARNSGLRLQGSFGTHSSSAQTPASFRQGEMPSSRSLPGWTANFLTRLGGSRLQTTSQSNFNVLLIPRIGLTRSIEKGTTINQQLTTPHHLTVLNLKNISASRSSHSLSTHSSAKTLVTNALRFVIPRVEQAQQLAAGNREFFPVPAMTYVQAQEGSSDRIIQELKSLRKSESQHQPVVYPQVPSIEQLTSQVKMQLERELRIERERRGL